MVAAVVLVITAFAEVSDFRPAPGARWQYLGVPEHDAFVASEFDAIADLVGENAVVAWATAPFEEGHEPGDTSMLNQRLELLNTQIRALAERRANVAVVPFAERIPSPGGRVDRAQRPDGIHFTVRAGREIADRWLARFLLRLAETRV